MTSRGKRDKPLTITKLFSNLKIEHVFLIIVLFSGLYLVFRTPPIAVVDEENHFFRALEISKGNIYTDRLNGTKAFGANLPANMVDYVYLNKGVALNIPTLSREAIKTIGQQKPDSSKLKEVVYNGSATYPPVGYIPQAIGMFIARVTGSSNETYLYLGRLLNLLAFVLLTFLAIKIIPIGKSIIFVAALLPMALYQAASLSADAIVMSSVFLSFALMVAVINRTTLPSKKLVIAMFFTICVVALAKYVYLILIFPALIYWVFSRKGRSRLVTAIIAVVIILFSLSLLFLWNSHLSSDVIAGENSLVSSAKTISTEGQLGYILSHPLAYTKSVIKLFFFDPVGGDVAVRGMIGRYGWLGFAHFASLVSMMLGFAAIFVAMAIDRQKRIVEFFHNLSKKRIILSIVFILSAIAAVLGIVSAMYLGFTTVGSNTIEGVQGRYFIPVIPVFLFGLTMLNPWFIDKINIHRAQYVLYGMVMFNILYATVAINWAFK